MEEAVKRFHRLYYQSGVWGNTYWLGVRTLKCPLDVWIYQEILFEKRPELIIETGTGLGGTTHFLACICDRVGRGRIVSVDWRPREGRPEHPRITYLLGSSIAQRTISQVQAAVQPHESVMVILDAAHEQDHVHEELRAYGQLVSPGQYMIVEDTNVNGHPVRPDFGPGPMEAVQAFLEEDQGREFTPDRSREKFLMTFNPSGYLLKR